MAIHEFSFRMNFCHQALAPNHFHYAKERNDWLAEEVHSKGKQGEPCPRPPLFSTFSFLVFFSKEKEKESQKVEESGETKWPKAGKQDGKIPSEK